MNWSVALCLTALLLAVAPAAARIYWGLGGSQAGLIAEGDPAFMAPGAGDQPGHKVGIARTPYLMGSESHCAQVVISCR